MGRLRPGADIRSQNLNGISPEESGRSAVAPVERILIRIGEPPKPPQIPPVHEPPGWGEGIELLPNWHAMAQPEPEYQFDWSGDS